MTGRVLSVSASPTHSFGKSLRDSIELLEGLGVKGDAHCGQTVKHRSRVLVDPSQPNLRQVHFIHSELFEELGRKGFSIAPGELGENILTEGVDLLSLPRDTLLHIGESALVRVTGLRNPCRQIEDFRAGLLSAVVEKGKDGKLIRKSGIMGVVEKSGVVTKGDRIEVSLPAGRHVGLDRV